MAKRILQFNDGFTSANAPNEAGYISVGSTQDISASGTISFSDVTNQVLKVQGDGAAVTASNTPFGTTPPENGTIFIIQGQDSTNTVTINNNDAADGCILNGDVTLGENDQVTVYYDSVKDRYVELNRNF